ncbi:MFS transporter, partial [bacterium]|nr:MFS transporter [bacterium]
MRAIGTGADVVRVYLATTALFTLAASIIWGVNTLFLLSAGLSLFQVMVVNASFAAGQLVFEVPTGVIADTIGRRASYLIGIAALFLSTLAYVASARFGWGMVGFVLASVALGFGFTCQTGAVDAWLVDALDHLGHPMPRETVFARGGMVAGVAMLLGTVVGGFLGQGDLSLPYVVRAGLLLTAFVLVVFTMRDIGFVPRPLRVSRFAEETRKIASAGITYGWRQPVVRPLLFVSLAQGVFFLFFFYSSQPYALQLLGRPDFVWVAGVLTALFGLTGVIGGAVVAPLMRTRLGARPVAVLVWGSVALAVLVGILAAVGMFAPPG